MLKVQFFQETLIQNDNVLLYASHRARIYDSEYIEVVSFFSEKTSMILFSLFLIFAYFFFALTIGEIFEDYIHNEKIKNIANKALYIFTATVPLITIISLINLI